jgi:hypothetical protein
VIPGIVAGFPAAPSGSFPVALTGVTSQQTGNQATQPVTMPTTAAGDLLIVSINNNSSTATTCATPSGWNLLRTAVASVLPRSWVFYRVADGSESGGTVNFVFSNNQRSTATCMRVQAGTYSGTPEITAWAQGNSNAPLADPLTPSWGADATLWYVIMQGNYTGTGAFTYPYADGNLLRENGSGLIRAATCWVESNTATLTPGAFATTLNTTWMAATIAVQPA